MFRRYQNDKNYVIDIRILFILNNYISYLFLFHNNFY